MDRKEKDLLYYEKLRTMLLGGVLLVLLTLLIGALVLVSGLRSYERQISGIIDRLDSVTVQLEDLDTERLVRTANELTEALDKAKIDEIVSSLNEVSGQLSEVDWTTLAGNINDMAVSARERLTEAEAALEKIGGIDFESLNEAISDLQDVIEPLSNFTKRFS